MNLLKRVTSQREFMIGAIVLAFIVAMTFASPYFLSTGNILALLLGLSIEAIIAVAMTNLLVSGGFDMSVGSIVAFTGAATAMLLTNGAPVAVAVVA
ncbi:MAG: ABC transporter permease, partial [Spirochaetaceae bacterium]|nr:ABC transporter permease [Spirochaetaceae bacterium]